MAGSNTTIYNGISIDAIYEALSGEAFLTQRAIDTGEFDVTFRTVEEEDKKTLYFDRFIETDLPKFMKKIYSPKSKLVEVQNWWATDDGYAGDYSCDIVGTPPIVVSGAFTLKPLPDGRVEHVITYDAKVKAPLIGKQIAKFVEKESHSGLTTDFAYNQSHIEG